MVKFRGVLLGRAASWPLYRYLRVRFPYGNRTMLFLIHVRDLGGVNADSYRFLKKNLFGRTCNVCFRKTPRFRTALGSAFLSFSIHHLWKLSTTHPIAMKIPFYIFNPFRSSSTRKAIRSNELWHCQQQGSRRAMSAMAMPGFRKQKDDGSGKLKTSCSRSRNVLLISTRGRNFRRRALSILSVPVAVRHRLFPYG